MPIAESKNRGCGKRVKGGAYLTTGTSPLGKPLEDFLIDPPIAINSDPFRTPQLFEKNGRNHVFVWIGELYYPTAVDFIEETRVMGVSRRVPSTFPFEQLGAGSMMYMIHHYGLVLNHQKITAMLETMGIQLACPKQMKDHCIPRAEQACIGLNYPLASLVTKGTEYAQDMAGAHPGQEITRKVGDTSYQIPDARNLGEPVEFQTAVFAAFPITRLEYVKGEQGEINSDIVEWMAKSTIPVQLCDE